MCWCCGRIANLSVSTNSEQARGRHQRFFALVDSVVHRLEFGSVRQWRRGLNDAASYIAMLGTALLARLEDPSVDPLQKADGPTAPCFDSYPVSSIRANTLVPEESQ